MRGMEAYGGEVVWRRQREGHSGLEERDLLLALVPACLHKAFHSSSGLLLVRLLKYCSRSTSTTVTCLHLENKTRSVVL